MERKSIEKSIYTLKKNIDYYTRVYGPNLTKIEELKKKLSDAKKKLERSK